MTTTEANRTASAPTCICEDCRSIGCDPECGACWDDARSEDCATANVNNLKGPALFTALKNVAATMIRTGLDNDPAFIGRLSNVRDLPALVLLVEEIACDVEMDATEHAIYLKAANR